MEAVRIIAVLILVYALCKLILAGNGGGAKRRFYRQVFDADGEQVRFQLDRDMAVCARGFRLKVPGGKNAPFGEVNKQTGVLEFVSPPPKGKIIVDFYT